MSGDWSMVRLKRLLLEGASPEVLLAEHGDDMSEEVRAWLGDHVAVRRDLEAMALDAALEDLESVSMEDMLGGHATAFAPTERPETRRRGGLVRWAVGLAAAASLVTAVWLTRQPVAIHPGQTRPLARGVAFDAPAHTLAVFHIDGPRPLAVLLERPGNAPEARTMEAGESGVAWYAANAEPVTLKVHGDAAGDAAARSVTLQITEHLTPEVLDAYCAERLQAVRAAEPEVQLDRARDALVALRALPLAARYGEAANLVGHLLVQTDDYQTALCYLSEAETALEQGADPVGLGYVRHNMGLAYNGSGLPKDTLRVMLGLPEAFFGVVGFVRPGRDPYTAEEAAFDAADAYNVLGGAYDLLDRPESSLTCYRRALDLLEGGAQSEPGSPLLKGNLFNNIGVCYNNLNDPLRAQVYFEDALSTFVAMDLSGFIAVVRANLGWSYYLADEPEQEMAQYAAIPAYADLRPRDRALVDLNRGLALMQQGDTTQGISQITQAAATYREIGDHHLGAYAALYLGQAYLAMGSPADADRYFQEGLVLTADGAPQLTVQLNTRRGQALAAMGRLKQAVEVLRQAVAVIEENGADTGNLQLRADYRASKIFSYHQLVDVLMRQAGDGLPGALEEALETAERARGRSLLEMQRLAHAEYYAPPSPEVLREEERLRAELNRLKGLEARYAQDPARNRAALARLEENQANLQRELRSVFKRLEEAGSQPAEPEPVRALTATEMKALAPEGHTLLVQYMVGEAQAYAWTVRGASVSGAAAASAEVLNGLAETARQALEDALQRGTKTAAAETALADLARVVLGPLGALPDGLRLAVVADGPLQQIPFELLPMADGRPLSSAHEVVYLPSFSMLAELRRRPGAGWSDPSRLHALIVADPVFRGDDSRLPRDLRATDQVLQMAELRPRDYFRSAQAWDLNTLPRLKETAREAAAVAALFPEAEAVTRLEGFDASRSRLVTEDLRHYQILHFATHGLVNRTVPEHSGLVLSFFDASGHARNGFLGMEDIYNLDLDASLVVLSACQTQVGREIKGEGIMGLGRAFMWAGAERVVASLWQVPDAATADLMQHFYRAMLHEGRTPPAALRAAQQAMAADPRYQNTYVSHLFVYQGDWR